MSAHRWSVLALVVMTAPGCHSSFSRKTAGSAEPGLATPAAPGSTVIEGTPARSVTFVDRHPLFSKPREYYDTTSGNSKVVKAAAATVIGIPAGIYGELKQIVVGSPQEVHY